MKTAIILTAAFALVLTATVAVQEPTLVSWQRFERDAPAGKVEVRPWQRTRTVWDEHPYGQYVRPFSVPWAKMDDPDPNDPYYPPGYPR